MPSNNDYELEMFPLRRDVLAMVAECARNDELWHAKTKGKRMIRRRANSENPSKVAKAFATSLENARDIVHERGDHDIVIEDMPPILDDHDGEIQPSEIQGDAVEVIRSIDTSGYGRAETTVYPVYRHDPSGWRVCSCPSQKYHIVCKHTLARVVERNLPLDPINQEA